MKKKIYMYIIMYIERTHGGRGLLGFWIWGVCQPIVDFFIVDHDLWMLFLRFIGILLRYYKITSLIY